MSSKNNINHNCLVFQRAKWIAQTIVREPGDIAVFQVHESRQRRSRQQRLWDDFLVMRVPKVARRFGAHDDHLQRDQQTGAGPKREETGGIVYSLWRGEFGIVHRRRRRKVGIVHRRRRLKVGIFYHHRRRVGIDALKWVVCY